MPNYVPTFLTSAHNAWRAEREGMTTVLQHGGCLFDLVLVRWRSQPQYNLELHIQQLNREVGQLKRDLLASEGQIAALRVTSDERKLQLQHFQGAPHTVGLVLQAEINRLRAWLDNSQKPRLAKNGTLHYLQAQILRRINRVGNHELFSDSDHDDPDNAFVLHHDSAAVPAA